MQIKTSLTLLFTSLVATLLMVFVLIVYFYASHTREEEYFKRLKQQGATEANLLFDTKVAPNVLQLIYNKAPNELYHEEVAIYDTTFRLLYPEAVEINKLKQTQAMIDSIKGLGEIRFYINNMQVVGFLYTHNGKEYIITSAAIDEYGLAKLVNLRNTLILSFLLSVIAIFFVGRFLAKISLQPVLRLVEKVKKITATNLDLRVDEGNRKDEISALAITFNEMLDRLENSFDAQKHFVFNISHELRTPLTTMLAEMQLTISKERDKEEYRLSIEHIISDTQKLIRLSNSLLDLAKASYDQTEISFKPMRLDEILLDARADVLHNKQANKVDIIFEKEIENDNYISINGNEYLLKVAFINLIENSCKFSTNNQSTVSISYNEKQAILTFSDNGIGICAQELQDIFTPFYRGANKKFVDGNGIGLSLTKKIILLHNGDISVVSKENESTSFTLLLPHL